jgi:hypothetical protein
MKIKHILSVAGVALLMAATPAQASLTTAQAQAEFNSAVRADAAEGITWRDCGSRAPLLNKANAGGWWARGSYITRGRVCAISTQVCDWYGYLSPSGYWIDRNKYNCR